MSQGKEDFERPRKEGARRDRQDRPFLSTGPEGQAEKRLGDSSPSSQTMGKLNKWANWAAALVIGIGGLSWGSWAWITGYHPDVLPQAPFGAVVGGIVLVLLSLHPLHKKVSHMRGEKKRLEAEGQDRHEEIWEALAEPPWSVSFQKVSRSLMVNTETGLSFPEATRRRQVVGSNIVEVVYVPGFLHTFFDEIYEPPQLLLITVGVLYAFLGSLEEALTALVVILVMAMAEIVTEWRAKRALARLRQSVPRSTTVIRAGRAKVMAVADVVPGDVVMLRAGMEVPADVRLVSSHMLEVDESSLTGESTPVSKDAEAVLPPSTPLGERVCMALAGSIVTRAKGNGIVVSTGAKTVLGKILREAKRQKPPRTPLQKSMKETAYTLSWVALAASFIGATLGLLRGSTWKEALLTALSLAFATIPEELPILIAGVLAVGGLALSGRGVYVKNLRAQESLAFVDVVLTDKTGTLTENRLILDQMKAASGDDDDVGGLVEAWLYTAPLLDISSLPSQMTTEAVDPFDRAVLTAIKGDRRGKVAWTFHDAAKTAFLELQAKRGKATVVKERPFESKTKSSATAFDNGRVYFKGAPEVLLSRSKSLLIDGEIVAKTNEKADKLSAELERLCKAGMRVVGYAVAEFTPRQGLEAVTGLDAAAFVGFMAFRDPVREGAAEAVDACHQAGVRVIMVTGDHLLTARAVAETTHILSDPRIADGGMTSKYGAMEEGAAAAVIACDSIGPADKARMLESADVFCRAIPEDKVELVKALQAKGHVVAVTGDGVNDAIALSSADVGLAMGNGTDVARAAAAVVITDNEFHKVTQALLEGRRLFDNLRKAIAFYLGAKAALVGLFIVLRLPLAPLQIIVLELFMDVGASTSFTIEPCDSDVMERPPRSPTARFFDGQMVLAMMVGSASLFTCVAGAFGIEVLFVMPEASAGRGQSVCFAAWLIGHTLLAINMRTTLQPVLLKGLVSNPIMLVWLACSLMLLAAVIAVDALRCPLGFEPLTRRELFVIAIVAVVTTCWIEVIKWFAWGVKVAGKGGGWKRLSDDDDDDDDAGAVLNRG